MKQLLLGWVYGLIFLTVFVIGLSSSWAQQAVGVGGIANGEAQAGSVPESGESAGQQTEDPTYVGRGEDTTLITFEAFPGPDGQLGTPDDIPIIAPSLFVNQLSQLTDQFASVGIMFVPSPPSQDMNEILNDSTFARTAGSFPNLLSTSRVAFPFGPIEARFTVPVRSISMAIGLGPTTCCSPNRLEIFDAADNLLDSRVGTDEVVTLDASVNIARFRVTATDQGKQAAIDDIRFVQFAGIPCDADGDGDVDLRDALAVFRFLRTGEPLLGDGDCNQDGNINLRDVLAILQAR